MHSEKSPPVLRRILRTRLWPRTLAPGLQPARLPQHRQSLQTPRGEAHTYKGTLYMSNSYFPRWRLVKGNAGGPLVVQPEERLTWPQNIAMGAQHDVAMFVSTILAPFHMCIVHNVAIVMYT